MNQPRQRRLPTWALVLIIIGAVILVCCLGPTIVFGFMSGFSQGITGH